MEFTTAYPTSELAAVNRENFEPFLGPASWHALLPNLKLTPFLGKE